MQLTSPAFAPNAIIPAAHTCKGGGTAPPLAIANTPAEARSLVLVVHDPDAPSGDFTHWVVWNIPADTALIAETQLPAGCLEGANDFGKTGYGAPCPPSGTHRYMFELSALDTTIDDLPPGSTRAALAEKMQSHIVAQAQLVGLVSAS